MPPVREHRIHNFLGSLIAFYRPRKKTYYMMSWSTHQGYWIPATLRENVGSIRRHGTGLHPTTSYVTIRLMNNTQVEISSIGHYLLIADCNVPIVRRVSGSAIPISFVNNEFGGVVEGEPHRRDVELWSVPPAVVAAPPTAPPPIRLHLKPLPKRIAWLISEDAKKNGDTCAITMEPINPLTAAVTTCFHCFDHEAIQTWMESHTTCPQCRERCTVTKAFEV
jgi:hypothetical protein